MFRVFRVVETTDSQHLGTVVEVDPDQVPNSYELSDGDVISVSSVVPLGDGLFRVSNPNYIAVLREID